MNCASLTEEHATLPDIIDQRAAVEPNRLFGAITRVDDNGKVHLRRVSYRDMSEAADRAAHWLLETLGRSESFESSAYVGPADLRYPILTMAAAKTGHKALLLSSWAPVTAHAKLLAAASCRHLLVAGDDADLVTAAQLATAGTETRLHPSPSLEWLLDGPPTARYPISMTIDQLRGRDYAVIHTSGSTGDPKLIAWKFNAVAAIQWLGKPECILPHGPTTLVKEVWKDKCHLLGLTPSHGVGLLALGPWAVYFNMPMILPPADRPLNPDIASQIFQHDLCEAAIMAPAHLQALTRDAGKVDALRHLHHVIWAGAPFPSTTIADAVRSRVRIECAFGSSEAALLALVPEHEDDYEWHNFHDLTGCQMRYFSEDLHEQILVRDPAFEKAQFVFQNFPDLDEFPTKDLFSRHPHRQNMWRFRGRKDDMITLSTGRNIEPAPLESAVASHSGVVAALVCGIGHTCPGLLVEAAVPPQTKQQAETLREEIWPTIDKANEEMDQHARIYKSMILFTSPKKPFQRADKGSVLRARTLKDYEAEIATLYKDHETE
ncbi:hypothetical protein QQS21_005646 [Conoideocrella luteorostrata]|uniref:AMP-dependent synthetase/ligase domain-containing protein n=1 Tax=Conoideocrella luteorostrata TaxID=1105319 RepID=A0AAJ0CS23_9HYPO|nr:hypothetical protein QQS21_005646 [Conoideocrella luteorostrata]